MAGKPTGKQKTIHPRQKQGQAMLQKKSFHIPPWIIYAILAVTAIIYSRALFNGFASLDDDDYLFDNPFIKHFNFESLKEIFSSFYLGNYHPLTTLTYLFEYKLYGLNAFPYHLFNILLHLMNVWLVYILINKLSVNRITALIVSLFFAIHPMHVESVAWISERKDVLYSLFYLLALIAYMRYTKSGFARKHYFATLVFFILSLLSKSASVTLPILLLAIDMYQKRKFNAGMLMEKIPFLLLSVLFGILALLSQQGAMKEVSGTFTFLDRIFLFSYTFAFYIVKLFVPFGLSAMHYYPEINGGYLPWYYYASLPFVLLLIWFMVRPTPFHREKWFGVIFFLIAISIMLQFIPVGNAIVAERYTYISYIGLFFIAGQWFVITKKIILKKIATVLIVFFALMFCYVSWERIAVWNDGYTLFTDVIKKYPDNFHGYWMRGNYKNDKEEYKEALKDYNKALEIYPLFKDGLNNRGHIYNKIKDYKNALKDLRLAIKLDSSFAEAYNNRGLAYDGLQIKDSALMDYNRAIELDPKLQKAYNNRGVLKATLGDIKSALEDVDMAIRLEPTDGEAYSNRGNIKAMNKDYAGAMADYDFALKRNPKDNIVMFNRGITKLNLGDTVAACADWEKARDLGNLHADDAIKAFCK